MRQIVLDTETTGLEPEQGHQIIEIGCVELVDRRRSGRTFHRYLRPDREIDRAAVDVHGIDAAFLADKPRFAEVASEFLEFVRGAELIIHNADFDIGFLDAEFARLDGGHAPLRELCPVRDTLLLARRLHPGQRASLDALCGRYGIDNSRRELHGALLDAQILLDVYLAMTGGQVALSLDANDGSGASAGSARRRIDRSAITLVVRRATEQERQAHELRLDGLESRCGSASVWRRLEGKLDGELDHGGTLG
ncbi:MAG: DNA polymerase III subunit epsilon [Pseudomonadota bacterium]